MKQFRADMHIHSVLSPCGGLDMSPVRIIDEAKRKNIQILAITDHNSTHHAQLMMKLGKEAGITVIPGAEINTKEEVHCLTFFETLEITEYFQKQLNQWLPEIQNNPSYFGDQLVVDEEENILLEEPKLLISALKADIYEIERLVHMLGGLFIPAHVDRSAYGICTQLGFIPDDLAIDGIEISYQKDSNQYLAKNPGLRKYPVLRNSDAHRLEDIGRKINFFSLETPEFNEIKMALRGQNGRGIHTE